MGGGGGAENKRKKKGKDLKNIDEKRNQKAT
jgi:hypothetical protein